MEQPIQHAQQQVSLDHGIMHWLLDSGIGLWAILGFAVIGVLAVFRKKIKEWLK